MDTRNMPVQNEVVHDVLIIGAGPCGLAVAARLRERTPSALYTDEERRRFHWLSRHGDHYSVKDKRTGRTMSSSTRDSAVPNPSLLILDNSSDRWMAKWRRQFEALKITHLRSPLFFHPSPQDTEALKAFAHSEGRSKELHEIGGCVGKELSKHKKKKRTNCRKSGIMGSHEIDERDREDYFTPSSKLFEDFCDKLARDYALEDGLIRQEFVQEIDYNSLGGDSPLFTVRTDRAVHQGRAVVVAVGSGDSPVIPAPFPSQICEGAVHSANMIPGRLIDPSLASKIRARKTTNVLVIGGGLSSAQITDAVLAAGVSRVWHLVRGPLRVKPFDVDLQWMGKFKNGEKSAFWMADGDEERVQLLRDAVAGGSITPRYRKILKKHENANRLKLCTETRVVAQHWSVDTQQWLVEIDPPVASMPAFDFIYFATGMQKGLETCQFLNHFQSNFPIHVEHGLPALTDDLSWREDIPLFVCGKMASLRLGPDAGNLGGARAGAERIAVAIQARREHNERCDSGLMTDDESGRVRYTAGIGSRWATLADEG
ncbi:hypothetical protein LTR56_019365 [Elasticomyces elasticus]|nr:hypothetical protein LTR56_019365 [Elasticomyces elasticus]KAK3658607.1 hypothetical protein LTR22_008779 [Elasticomyces elasticus]KAK4911379.1 hypothetical protein LTR49_020030 [Elasticomyces elasticus]KAK5747039.1 hypothetical protein LTS12_022505 [Elasticomyces elasticus]